MLWNGRTVLKTIIGFKNASSVPNRKEINKLTILGKDYFKDDYTNITEKINSHLCRHLHNQNKHPLCTVKQRILNYFYKNFVNRRSNPIFSLYDNLPPVVSVKQNFDELLIPQDHVSRLKSDCYYLNRQYLLRAHMTAHQSELMRMGLDNFLMAGDVYRRDEIDKTHYPVFHQVDAVRLKTRDELFANDEYLQIFEAGDHIENIGNQNKQACHSLEAAKLMEYELKNTLEGLAKHLFGDKCELRWMDSYFPFTLPSWELEVFDEGRWLELLGCGIMMQPILTNAGIRDKIGWAFGLGLERLAMHIYKIPDIRLFWSKDTGFLNQFDLPDINANIVYKSVSQFPQCTNDISFWLPENNDYNSNDFYDIVRSVGGDFIEQVSLIDNFQNKKTGKISHCYRIVYRHMEKTFTQNEVNEVHENIAKKTAEQLFVTIR